MALGQNTRQDLDQAVHIGLLAHERRKEAQRMCACSVDHGTSPQCTGHDVVCITRGIIQIAAEHQAATTHLYHMRKLSQRLLHIGANLGSMLGIIAVHKRGERRGTRRDGQAAVQPERSLHPVVE